MENDFSRQHLAIFSAGSCLCGFADASGLGWCGNCGLLQSHDTSLDFMDAIADPNFHGTVPQCLLLGDIGSNLYIDPSHTLQTASRDPDPDLAPVTPTARQVSRAETNSQYAFETCRSMHHDAQWSQRDPRLTGPTVKPQDTYQTSEIEAQDLRLLDGNTAGNLLHPWTCSMVSPAFGTDGHCNPCYVDSDLVQGLLPNRNDHLMEDATAGNWIYPWTYRVSPAHKTDFKAFEASYGDSDSVQVLMPHRKDHPITHGTHGLLAQDLQS
jgi:hypothetical protein